MAIANFENQFNQIPHSPDLAPRDYKLFVDLKKKLQGKRFNTNEVLAATDVYFEEKEKLFYKHVIENLRKYWNNCTTLEVSPVNY